MSNVVEIKRGSSAIILSQPHGGTFISPDIASKLNKQGQQLSDTDWHIDRLYDGLLNEITIVKAQFHRYMIDANRDPDGHSLYPDQNTTSLCSLTDFDGVSIYKEDEQPSAKEVLLRIEHWHRPYHKALEEEISRVKSIHGFAIVYDCHSIRSHVPYLFEGTLPVFNIGTNLGQTCSSLIEEAVAQICHDARGFDVVLNGRFKGGWSTRHYGQPLENVHAIQMELAQRCYMDEFSPWNYRVELAGSIRVHLVKILDRLNQIANSGALLNKEINQ